MVWYALVTIRTAKYGGVDVQTADDDDARAERLLDIAPAIVRAMERELRQQGQRADATHVQILTMLVERPHTVSELAGRQRVSLPSMSKTVQALVERGWIERTAAPHDQRVVIVRLTVSGGDALREARAVLRRWLQRELVALPELERAQLSAGLAVLETLVRQATTGAAEP